MEQEALKRFRNKEVKLTYKNGFNLKGSILEVYQDSILFRTQQASSLISLEEISSVVEVR